MPEMAISARFGIDATGARAELASLPRAAQQAGNAMSSGLQFKNDRFVKKQIAGLTQSIMSGASATDLFAQAAFRLFNSFKAGLGIGAAIIVGGGLLKSVLDARKEAKKLDEDIRNLARDPGDSRYRSLEDIQERLTKIREKADEVKKHLNGGWFDQVKDSIASGSILQGTLPGGDWRNRAEQEKQAATAAGAEKRALDDIAAKQQAIADIEDARVQFGERAAAVAKIEAEFAEKIGEASKQGAGGFGMVSALMRQQQQAINKAMDAGGRAAFGKVELINREDISKQAEQAAEAWNKEFFGDLKNTEAMADKAADAYEATQTAIDEAGRTQGRSSAVGAAFETLDAQAGKGQSAEMRLLDQKIAILQASKSAMEAAGDDSEGLMRTNSELAKMIQSRAELAEQQAKAVRDAQSELEVTDLQNHGQKTLAEVAKLRHEYAEKITQAEKDGNTALADTLRQQEHQDIRHARAEELMKSPAEQRSERAQERRVERAERLADAKANDAADALARGAHDQTGRRKADAMARANEKPATHDDIAEVAKGLTKVEQAIKDIKRGLM